MQTPPQWSLTGNSKRLPLIFSALSTSFRANVALHSIALRGLCASEGIRRIITGSIIRSRRQETLRPKRGTAACLTNGCNFPLSWHFPSSRFNSHAILAKAEIQYSLSVSEKLSGYPALSLMQGVQGERASLKSFASSLPHRHCSGRGKVLQGRGRRDGNTVGFLLGIWLE
jgi:hypothetical protein